MFKCIACWRFTEHDKVAYGEMMCIYHCRNCMISYPQLRSLAVYEVEGKELDYDKEDN